jgi:hypothetical protein
VNERADERLRMPVNGAGSALRDPSFGASRVHVQAGKFSGSFFASFYDSETEAPALNSFSLYFSNSREDHTCYFLVFFFDILDGFLSQPRERSRPSSAECKGSPMLFDYEVLLPARGSRSCSRASKLWLFRAAASGVHHAYYA